MGAAASLPASTGTDPAGADGPRGEKAGPLVAARGQRAPAAAAQRPRSACLAGKVVKVLPDKRFGFLRGEARQGSESSDVYFHFDRLKFGLLDPAPGDCVSYTLMDPASCKRGGPTAREVRPLKLCSRPAAVLGRYVQLILDRVQSDEHADLRKAAFDVASCRPAWALLLNADLSPPDARGVVDFVLVLGAMRGFQAHFSSFVEGFCGTRFLEPEGPLHDLAIDEPELADRFILCALRCSKSVARSLLTLLTALADEAEGLYPDSALCHQVIRHLLVITRAVSVGEMEASALPWYDVPLVPKVHEMFSDALHGIDSLSPVLERGAYDSDEGYLDTYFRLLRFDCFAEFNVGIKSFVNGAVAGRSNLCTYHNIVLKGIQLLESGSGIGLVVQIKADRPPKDWKSAPHLRFGNLVCISPSGGFKDPLWAVVADRDVERLRKDQTTFLELCGAEHNSMGDAEAISMLLESKRTAMVESPTYYKAFEPVMRALQSLPESEELPFSDMLVFADFSRNCCVGGILGSESDVDASLIFKLDKIVQSPFFRSPAPSQAGQSGGSSSTVGSSSQPLRLSNHALLGSNLQWDSRTRCERISSTVKKYTISDPGSVHSKELAEYNMAFAQFSRLVSRGRPKIVQIDVYENPDLEANFKAESANMVREGVSPEETWVFHGTSSSKNVEAIMKDGFKVGGQGDVPIANGAAYGNGVYSATGPDTPMAYGSAVKQVILAMALKGRSGPSKDHSCNSWLPRADWIVFRSGGQLLPRYVVHYTDCVVPEQSISIGSPALVGCHAKISTLINWISALESYSDSDLIQFTALDRGQLRSIQTALQNRISLIQGPPGTGKTFIGVKIVQMFLSASTFPKDRPILVLTYKNHALDEFLVDCISKLGSDKVIRVGGRSSEKMLESRNLNVIKREFQKEQSLFDAFKKARDNLEDSKMNVKSVLTDFRCSFDRLTVDEFLDQAYDQQIEHLLNCCDWSREVLPKDSRKVEIREIEECLEKLKNHYGGDSSSHGIGSSESLKHVLLLDLDGDLGDSQAWLLDVLQRALDLWYPEKCAFETFKRISVLPPPPLFEDITSDAIDSVLNLAEVDIEEEEPERLASEQAQKWRAEDFIKLDVGKNQEYRSIDIPSICSDSVASCLLQYSALWDLDSGQRACLICMWMQNSRQQRLSKLNNALQKFSDARKALREVQDSHEADVLRHAKIVGMTITGAALRSGVLGQVKPAVIIVEEAAEVLETQLLACIGPWVQRLVMIGDHKQLRPQVTCYELVKRCNFDVSMFERLINNGIEHGVLNTQNRMRPEFVEMLRQIYPTLRSNHARVDANQAPQCISKSMFFWTHSDPETPGQSLSNNGECHRVVSLALFFVQQGYSPSKVTVLAAYRGQTKLIREALKKHLHTVWEPAPAEPGSRVVQINGREHSETDLLKKKRSELLQLMKDCGLSVENLQSVKDMTEALLKSQEERAKTNEIVVHTIDQYQGDENDIIIVSLVRSNQFGDIGFLKTVNRYCVAVSRARCGVYFVGNSDTLQRKSEHWRWLCNVMEKQEKAGIGQAIPLRCPRHPTCERQAKHAADIDLKHGICKMRCDFLMPCGVHRCSKPCHSGGAEHALHQRCMHRVTFCSPCGHTNEKPCYMKDADFACQMPCKIPLSCGHPCRNLCGQPCATECLICIKEIRDQQEQEEAEIQKRMNSLLSKAKRKKVQLYPSYWDTCSADMEGKFRLLDVTGRLMTRMQNIVDRTCDRLALGQGVDQLQRELYSGLRVVRVQHIENPGLWRRYRLRYTELLEDLRRLPRAAAQTQLVKNPVLSRPDDAWNGEARLDKDVRESYLFHGTSPETALRIAADGFEERLARLSGLYGAGAYFAERSNKSDQYTAAGPDGLRCMFVARVLLGAHVLDSPTPQNDLRILPDVPRPAAGGGGEAAAAAAAAASVRHSSLLGLFGAHREFVVYNGAQAYPEYLLHYRRQ